MSAIPILLATAITAVINTAEDDSIFAPHTFTARRSYPDWDDDFKDLKDLVVDVVFVSSNGTNGDQIGLDTVSALESEPAVDIAIRKRFNATDREADGRLKKTSVDPLVTLVEQLHELLAGDRATELDLTGGLSANWLEASVRTHCDYKRLREGVFLGLVRVRYNVSKAVP